MDDFKDSTLLLNLEKVNKRYSRTRTTRTRQFELDDSNSTTRNRQLDNSNSSTRTQQLELDNSNSTTRTRQLDLELMYFGKRDAWLRGKIARDAGYNEHFGRDGGIADPIWAPLFGNSHWRLQTGPIAAARWETAESAGYFGRRQKAFLPPPPCNTPCRRKELWAPSNSGPIVTGH